MTVPQQGRCTIELLLLRRGRGHQDGLGVQQDHLLFLLMVAQLPAYKISGYIFRQRGNPSCRSAGMAVNSMWMAVRVRTKSLALRMASPRGQAVSKAREGPIKSVCKTTVPSYLGVYFRVAKRGKGRGRGAAGTRQKSPVRTGPFSRAISEKRKVHEARPCPAHLL